MTDEQFLDGLRDAIETILEEVYVSKRADSAVFAAREEMSLEGFAACRIVARIGAAVDQLIADVAESRRREPFFP